ncbi:hypothetical protein [uncultured Methylobacterium sp.]|uniref:hypothetical protein n=1 Tax=uncultured Methylobacterium sp. TaxID=157278 RepID=UPI0035C9536F
MLKIDLHPPQAGPGSDPVLYGVAAGLAELFPPVIGHDPAAAGPDLSEDEDEQD